MITQQNRLPSIFVGVFILVFGSLALWATFAAGGFRQPGAAVAQVGPTTTTVTRGSTATASTGEQAPADSPNRNIAISDRRRISVTGLGIVSATPDMLTVQIGVEVQREKLEEAQDEAAVSATNIITELKQSGIAESDIATAFYNIEPVMNNPESDAPTVTGFRVTHVYKVTMREIDRAGEVIDSLVASGANRIFGLTFTFADPTAVARQAWQSAMDDARAKAQQLARLSGVTLGEPLLIDESVGGPVPVRDSVGVGGTAPPISPGQQEVRVQVSVTYAIE